MVYIRCIWTELLNNKVLHHVATNFAGAMLLLPLQKEWSSTKVLFTLEGVDKKLLYRIGLAHCKISGTHVSYIYRNWTHPLCMSTPGSSMRFSVPCPWINGWEQIPFVGYSPFGNVGLCSPWCGYMVISCPDHTKLSVRFQPWNCWGLCWEIDVGPPRFTLLQLKTDGWCQNYPMWLAS